MPICQKCKTSFPNRVTIDGKCRILCNRKYCLNCSPFGLHNTSQLHKRNRDGSEKCVCECCERPYVYVKAHGHARSRCNSCVQRERKRRIKQKAVEYLGGSCERCGYRTCIDALDFHHRDTSTKTFNVGSKYNVSWEKLKGELDKCVLLCANCHREEHFTNGRPGRQQVLQQEGKAS